MSLKLIVLLRRLVLNILYNWIVDVAFFLTIFCLLLIIYLRGFRCFWNIGNYFFFIEFDSPLTLRVLRRRFLYPVKRKNVWPARKYEEVRNVLLLHVSLLGNGTGNQTDRPTYTRTSTYLYARPRTYTHVHTRSRTFTHSLVQRNALGLAMHSVHRTEDKTNFKDSRSIPTSLWFKYRKIEHERINPRSILVYTVVLSCVYKTMIYNDRYYSIISFS